MSKLPSLLHGPIALEYGEVATTIHAGKEKTGATCGSECTNPNRECEGGTCPAHPGPDKDKKKKEKRAKYAFVPSVAGWSEPPVTRV